jgi:hypothetical protein
LVTHSLIFTDKYLNCVGLFSQDDESDFEDDFELAEQELYRSDSDEGGDINSEEGLDDERERGKDIRFSDFFAADNKVTTKKSRNADKVYASLIHT